MRLTNALAVLTFILIWNLGSSADQIGHPSMYEPHSNAKISSNILKELPDPLYSPIICMAIDIYLTEGNFTRAADLEPYVIKILYDKDGMIEAQVRSDQIFNISDLSFVSYVDFPRLTTLNAYSTILADPPSPSQQTPSKDSKICSFLSERVSPVEYGKPPIRGIAGGNETAETVLVDIYLNNSEKKNLEQLKPLLKDLRYSNRDTIEAEVSMDNVIPIRNLSFVSYLDIPRLQYKDEGSIVKPIAVEQNTMCTSDLLNQGISGKGVTVAVLDTEFYSNPLIDNVLNPNVVRAFPSGIKFTPNQVHGMACAELIHSIAPDARIYLVYSGNTEADFINATEKLEHLDKKVDAVSCSQEFMVGSFDGKDRLCQAIKNVTDRGTIWVNSAGNEAQCHWTGTFNDPNGDGFNKFGGKDKTINFTAKRGGRIDAILSWNDDWLKATQDYDLYVYSPDGSYAASQNPQKGYYGHKPEEIVSMIAPMNGVYQIAIKKYNATRTDTKFQLFVPHYKLDTHNVNESSVGVLGCSPDVITVGAVDVSTLKLEPFSSRGPTMDGRMKPELVAPDNDTTLSYWPHKFAGTSASAPFVAGCAALAIEKLGNPGCNIKDALIASARPLGSKTPNNDKGYGLVYLCPLNCNK